MQEGKKEKRINKMIILYKSFSLVAITLKYMYILT